MKISFSILLFMAIYLMFSTQLAHANGVIFHYDYDGNVIDKINYEILVFERDKAIAKLMENGYDIESDVWKDPIKLRKKRIEQWEKMRSRYSRDSLPNNIEQ